MILRSPPPSPATRLALLAVTAWIAGCGAASGGAVSGLGFGDDHGCIEDSRPIPLPPELRESSGVVASIGGDFYWSHNDSGHPNQLLAISDEGELLGVVRVQGARNVDWEDLAAGPCPPDAEGARCLYIADLGDNAERRTDPAVYRVPEPLPGDSETLPAERFPIRLPHGPRDIEALYVLPGERIFFITKGRSHPIELYRVPPLAEAGVPLEPERIQILADRPRSFARMVTGAGADPEGRRVAVRTYETLEFFDPLDDGTLVPSTLGRVNLRPLREPQGEAVAILDDGRIVLTSEAGPGLRVGSMRFLRCEGLREDHAGEG